MLYSDGKIGNGDMMPDYRCIVPNCRFNKKITHADAKFFRNHLQEHHFEKIANIALGTSCDFKDILRALELKSRVAVTA